MNVNFIETALYSLHLMAATRIPAMEISQTEALALAEAVAKVAEHYPVVSKGMSPEAQAWFGLATTAGMVYGPKLVPVVIEKMTAPKKPAPGQPPQNRQGHPIQ